MAGLEQGRGRLPKGLLSLSRTAVGLRSGLCLTQTSRVFFFAFFRDGKLAGRVDYQPCDGRKEDKS